MGEQFLLVEFWFLNLGYLLVIHTKILQLGLAAWESVTPDCRLRKTCIWLQKLQ